MLKVECESCRAPYQIDERRVPAAGLKMRCPKCGHSFVVNNPNAAKPAGPPAPPPKPTVGPQATAASPKKVPQRTIVGIAPPAPAPKAPAAATPARAPSPPPMRAPMPSDFPAALGSLQEGDLPVVSGAALPAMVKKAPPPPVPQRVVAKPAVRAPLPAQPFADLDLPALPSDLPVTRGADLPATRADLPALRGAPRAPAASPASPRDPSPIDIDLPIVAPNLPSPKRGGPARDHLEDLPVVAGDLPSISAGLPVVSAQLPVVSAHLPAVSAHLPAIAAGLPSISAQLPSIPNALPAYVGPGLPTHVAPGLPIPVPAGLPAPGNRGFGEIDLPSDEEVAPPPRAAASGGHPAPVSAGGRDPFGDFGELDLPTEAAPIPPPFAFAATTPQEKSPSAGEVSGMAAFGELDFGGAPERNPEPQHRPATAAAAPRASTPPPNSGGSSGGGIGFGERDLGGGGSVAEAPSFAMEAPIPTTPEPQTGTEANVVPLGAMDRRIGGAGGFEAPLSASAKPVRERPIVTPKSRRGKFIVASVFAAVAIGGAFLELTPYGAFGRNAIADMMNAKAYAAATTEVMTGSEKRLSVDGYDDAKGAVDDVAAAHARTPRAKPLTAYAIVVDGYVATRYGVDPQRSSRAKQWMAELPPNVTVQYRDVAAAAQSAASGDLDNARKGLDAASQHDTSDPIQLDVALLRGEVELDAHDGAAALLAFQKALKLAPQDARAHFGAARAYARLRDLTSAKKEIDVTLAVSPNHAGGLLARAESTRHDDPAGSQKDVTAILDGPARPRAAPGDVADAFALRGWLAMDHAATSDARTAFDEALKIDPRSFAALLGQGELLYNEARYTEALTRFDTALQVDATSTDAIVSDVKTKIALERLQDAKTQLTDANTKFPKTMRVLMWLGKVESSLGNAKPAEQDLRDAITAADPKQGASVLPFVWLASLLAQQGRPTDAQAVLDDAKKKLPDSAALQRAFGEVSEAQGKYDDAAKFYVVAIGKDPTDVSTHFRLAIAYRHTHDFDRSTAEFAKVEQADKDYPGLALARGLLYEESGDIAKAIDAFNSALAKAPDDLDLQVRVAAAYVMTNKPDQALAILKKVLEKRANSPEVKFYEGRAYLEQGQLTDALRELKRAVDLDPNRAEYHLYLGWASSDAGKLDEARVEIDKALSLDRLLPEAYWQKGVLQCKLAAIDDGLKSLHEALRLSPKRYEVHAAIATCYDQKNDRGTQMAEWAQAVDGDRGQLHPEWRYQYGALLLDQGNSGAALGHLVFAVAYAEKRQPAPVWAPDCEYRAALALERAGKKQEAIDHYSRFVLSAPNSAQRDVDDAKKRRAQLQGR